MYRPGEPRGPYRMLRDATIALLTGVVLASCSIVPTPPPNRHPAAADAEERPSSERSEENKPVGLLDPAIRHRAEQIIATFETGDTAIPYANVEEDEDGRGVTAGRAGFTSGTGDLLEVVELYEKTTNDPDNLLRVYLPALKTASRGESVRGFDGFAEAWEETSYDDPALNAAQDAVYEELYLKPALRWAEELGIQSAVGQLIILDTIIQHGEGDDDNPLDDADSLRTMVAEALDEVGEPSEVGEEDWLWTFLEIRRQHLLDPADPDTREVWAESVDRVDSLEEILDSGNLYLRGRVEWDEYSLPPLRA